MARKLLVSNVVDELLTLFGKTTLHCKQFIKGVVVKISNKLITPPQESISSVHCTCASMYAMHHIRLGLLHTGDKIDFDSVDFVEVDRIEVDVVASVYEA